jgi:hypothetical protein
MDPIRPVAADEAAHDVTRPLDLVGASLRELLDAWHGHIGRLVDARHGIGDPLPPARLTRHALDGLATGQALADQLMASRWVTAADALTYGATLAQTATAMGLEVDEVTAGLRSWADGQHRHELMTAAQRDDIRALLDQ